MWRTGILYQEVLADKEVQDSVANGVLDDEEQEFLVEAQTRARLGADIEDFEHAVDSLYNHEQMIIQKRHKLWEMKVNHREFMIPSAVKVFSAASFLQRLQTLNDLHDHMPLVELEQSMQEFCAGQHTGSYTEEEKAACTVIQGVLPTLENKRKAIEELLLAKDTLLKERLILCIRVEQQTGERDKR